MSGAFLVLTLCVPQALSKSFGSQKGVHTSNGATVDKNNPYPPDSPSFGLSAAAQASPRKERQFDGGEKKTKKRKEEGWKLMGGKERGKRVGSDMRVKKG